MSDTIAHRVAGAGEASPVPEPLRRLSIDLFASLRAASFDGVGVSRETYGESETEAMEIVAQQAAHEGLTIEWDPARNLVISLHGRNPELPAVATGSHPIGVDDPLSRRYVKGKAWESLPGPGANVLAPATVNSSAEAANVIETS